tara:strand:- start:307 stop:537 length:231 start_codon:yes stop_codon:yes gene_type:complete
MKMYIEDIKITIRENYSIAPVKKGGKVTKREDVIGNINIDWGMDNESLDALVNAITEKVFKHDPVKLEVSFNAHNC